MNETKITAERLSAFSDAVFAVIVTIMVLELAAQVAHRARRLHRRMLVAFVAPRVGFGLICAALVLHLRPEVPEFSKR
jgi:uncharacterized membrane protein